MKPVLLIDFGSTYTKVTAVDLDAQELLATSCTYTTVETDICEGLENAMKDLNGKIGRLKFTQRFACSSAAGGLRMIASGLVPELTVEAARLASLGAGAKIVKTYSYQLTNEDVDEITQLTPDIFLLTGGIDGGNQECILHNAKMLAGCESEFPILIAGNRSCARECELLLSNREVYRCENVMPRLGQLNILPVQSKIRELFLQRIIFAKGLSNASELITGILMPTPSSMLRAVELLAKGTKIHPGLGELVAVDLGGATTDVYSIASSAPQNGSTMLKGLPEPYSKRTVEGDIGMRYSVHGILETVGLETIARLSGLEPEQIEMLLMCISKNPRLLPDTPHQEALDYALASAAIEIAVTRHAGIMEQVYTPMGPAYVQTGKDLTHVKKLVVTGGAIIHTKHGGDIAAHALYDLATPTSLKPKSVNVFIDRQYILPAMGLLSEEYPDSAFVIMKKELEDNGSC